MGDVWVEHSDIHGGWIGAGTNNINLYPIFVNFVRGDLHLQMNSPCINMGDNASLPPDEFDLDGDEDTGEPIPLDLDGNPRVVVTVDMGAFEYPCVVDLDGDGGVGPADLAALLGSWGSCNGVCMADFNNDGEINAADLAQLLGAWGKCG